MTERSTEAGRCLLGGYRAKWKMRGGVTYWPVILNMSWAVNTDWLAGINHWAAAGLIENPVDLGPQGDDDG